MSAFCTKKLLQGLLCHGWLRLVHVVYNVSYASLFAIKLVKDKIKLRVKQICLSNITDQTLQKTKLIFEKNWLARFTKTTIAIRFKHLQVRPSAHPFAFAVLFIPSFNVFNQIVAVSTVWILINFVRQLLVTPVNCVRHFRIEETGPNYLSQSLLGLLLRTGETNSPIADRHVTSNDPRINCGTYFGSRSLLVSKVTNRAHSLPHQYPQEWPSYSPLYQAW